MADLLIELQTYASEYEDLLRESELVRGVPTEFKLTVTNISDEAFVGGRLTKFQITIHYVANRYLSLSLSEDELSQRMIPALGQKESIDLEPFTMNLVGAGVFEIEMEASATEGEELRLYTRPGKAEQPWKAIGFVVERIGLEIIQSLRRMERE